MRLVVGVTAVVLGLAGCGGGADSGSPDSPSPVASEADVARGIYSKWWVDAGVKPMVLDDHPAAPDAFLQCSSPEYVHSMSAVDCDQAMSLMGETAGYIIDDISSFEFPMTDVVSDLESTQAADAAWSEKSCMLFLADNTDLTSLIECQAEFVTAQTGLLSAMNRLKEMSGL